jgi:phage protein D
MPDGGTINLYNARPTLRVNGQQDDRIDAQVVEMLLREQVGGLSSLEVKLIDSVSGMGVEQYGFSDERALKLGAEIRLYTGTVTGPQEIFRGRVSALEVDFSPQTPPMFVVLAEDALQKARRTRRSATYIDMSPADVVRHVAQNLGLIVNVRDGLDTPTGHWVQMNESDLAFLRRLLDRFDADLQMVGDTLQVGPRAREGRGRLDLVHGDNLIRLRATADLADVAPSVRVAGWDAQQGRASDSTVTDGTLGPGSGRAGKDLVTQAIDAGPVELVGTQGHMTGQEAEAMARAQFGQRSRHFVRAVGTAQGDPRLRVGTWVNLLGINPLLSTTCTVIEAVHRFDQTSGYTTDFVAEGAYMGSPR